MTGYGARADQWRSADAGIDLHLVKPDSLTRMLSWVREVLGRHNANEQTSPAC